MALTYLHRTPSTAATNTKKATFSYWTKTTGISINDQSVWFGNEASNSQSNHRVLIMKQNNTTQASTQAKQTNNNSNTHTTQGTP